MNDVELNLTKHTYESLVSATRAVTNLLAAKGPGCCEQKGDGRLPRPPWLLIPVGRAICIMLIRVPGLS